MAGRGDIESSAAASPDAESDESTPLLGEDEDHLTRIDHKESVYSFMLFQPPISRKVHKHYWTVEVLLAFALLVLNLTLQVGLTWIAGTHILQNSQEFQTTLVSLDTATTPWERVIDVGKDQTEKVTKTVSDTAGAVIGSKDSGAAAETQCCNGAECAEVGMQCCDRTGATAHTPHEPMRKNFTQADVQNKIPGGNNVTFLQLLMGKPKKKASDDSEKGPAAANSLCVKHGKNKTLSCSPPSYEYLDMWQHLDKNADGMWTLEEARADEANLGCHLGLPVEEIFRSVCRGVEKDNLDTSEHPPYNIHLVPLSVTERRAVPKAYFDWWRGLAVICVAHDVSRCGQLISKGMFDGAIGAGQRFTKGGVRDLDSALDYCQRLLRPGGMCEKTLPGNYMTYRSRVSEKCGPPTFRSGGRYLNPFDDRDVMSTISVAYSRVDQYTTASTTEFCFFQGLILFLWFVNLVGELKSVIQLGDFIFSFEHDDHFPIFTPHMRRAFKRSFSTQDLSAVGGDDSDDEKVVHDTCIKDEDGFYEIKRISRVHKFMVTMMLFVRFALLLFMFHVGSMFLLTNHKYDDLLLNAVALAFIFELPEFLYTFLVSDEMKSDLEGTHTSDYVTSLPTRGIGTVFFSKSLWGIVIIPAIVVMVVIHNYQVTTMPSLRALQCTCFQVGPSCDVASRFSREWWNGYWKEIHQMFEMTTVFR